MHDIYFSQVHRFIEGVCVCVGVSVFIKATYLLPFCVQCRFQLMDNSNQNNDLLYKIDDVILKSFIFNKIFAEANYVTDDH